MKHSNTICQPELTARDIPVPIVNTEFIADIKKAGISFSDDAQDRLFRGHGNVISVISINYYTKFLVLYRTYFTRNIYIKRGQV